GIAPPSQSAPVAVQAMQPWSSVSSASMSAVRGHAVPSRSFLKYAFESNTSTSAFFNQRRITLGSIAVASRNVAWAALCLPTGFNSGSSNACPFQNNRLTVFAVTLYPTTGFSPTNQTGLPCQILDVALGMPSQMSSRRIPQIVRKAGG